MCGKNLRSQVQWRTSNTFGAKINERVIPMVFPRSVPQILKNSMLCMNDLCTKMGGSFAVDSMVPERLYIKKTFDCPSSECMACAIQMYICADACASMCIDIHCLSADCRYLCF